MKFRSLISRKKSNTPSVEDVADSFNELKVDNEDQSLQTPEISTVPSQQNHDIDSNAIKKSSPINPFDDDEDQLLNNSSLKQTQPAESTLSRQNTATSTSRNSFAPSYRSSALPNSTGITKLKTATTLNSKGIEVVANVGTGNDNDLIIMRLQAWKHIVKAISAFFSSQAENCISQAKTLPKLDSNLVIKLADSQFFMDNGCAGVLDIVGGIKMMNKTMADQLGAFSAFLNSELVPQLQALRKEIKNEVKKYCDNISSSVSNISKIQKDIDDESIKLSKSVDSHFKQQYKNDPWLCNQGIFLFSFSYASPLTHPPPPSACMHLSIIKYLKKRCVADDAYFRLMQSEIARVGSFDSSLSERLSKIIHNYTQFTTKNIIPNDLSSAGFLANLANVDNSMEWVNFMESYASALSSPMGRLSVNSHLDVDYPHKDSDYVAVIKSGSVEREKGLIKSFSRAFLVLTNLGYLHSFGSESDVENANPDISLFIVKASVEKSHNNTITIKIPSGYPGKGTQNIKFSDAKEMEDWISAIRSKMDTVS
ncbi:hypothetical protein AYI69_g7330 [Smittium culicis]|uniref:PH domain-containing protein n=2 Tax=Smittium culicis TaxID=133412 RepID=A0A1R1XSU4_9FUNG|nr:hypothetical protein AYI69_g7330 [Smittium culicis]